MWETILYILLFIKNKLFWVLGLAVWYFSPIQVSLITVGAAILLDTLIGRWAAKKIAQRDKKDVRLEVTSKKTRRGTLSKMGIYQGVIMMLFIMDDYLLNPFLLYIFPNFPVEFFITKFIGFVLVLIEADSIDEKVYRVKNKRISTMIIEKIKGLKKAVFKIKGDISDLQE